MGIRFFCPSGHRLNVKSFLAGKRGVCPDCGMPVDIPRESDQRALSSKRKQLIVGGGENEDAKATAVLEQSDDAERPEVDISTPVPPAGRPYHDFALPASLDLPATDDRSVATTSPVVTTPNFAFETVRPAPVSTVSSTSNGVPLPKVAAPIGTAVAVPVVTAPAVAAPTAAPPPVNDAISEAPMAIWYVRPTAGGQFGPARGDVMRKWLGEGRVTNDSLVWREGWPDWRPATKVFPDLGSKPATPLAEMSPIVPAAPRRAVRPARKTSAAQGVGIVIALGVVCVGLFAALLYVLTSGTGAPPAP